MTIMSSASIVSLSSTTPPSYNLSPENISLAQKDFSSFLSEASILSSPSECHARASNAWTPTPFSQRPSLVLLPTSTADVSSILKICHARRIPVTAFAGGTALPGALTSTRGGVCVDFGKMDKVLAVHGEDMDVVVQPGVGWMDLNRQLKEVGLFFPPDPSPDAKIGGMIAMSCAGTSAYRHGTMKEWVISLTTVLADGTVVKTKQRPRKSSAGYDLTRLIVGSEGTLALVTEAVLKLASLPKNQHVAVVTFPDAHAAVNTALELVNSGVLFDAVELMDNMSVHALNVSNLSPRYWEERPTVWLKVSGSEHTVEDLLAIAKEAAERNGCQTFEATGDREEMEMLWNARKMDGKATLALKRVESDVAMACDAAVPISRVADLTEESHRLIREKGDGMIGSITAHLGDGEASKRSDGDTGADIAAGNLHVKLVYAADQKEEAENIMREIERLAIRMEGTITGEHGIGLKLRDGLIEEIGDSAINMMRSIKLALDPLCILNPDKVFRLESSI